MKTSVIAKYYDDDGQVVIYGDRCKLTEFPASECSNWNLPPVYRWKKTDYGAICYIEFIVRILHDAPRPSRPQ